MHGTDTRTVGHYAGIRVPEHEKTSNSFTPSSNRDKDNGSLYQRVRYNLSGVDCTCMYVYFIPVAMQKTLLQ